MTPKPTPQLPANPPLSSRELLAATLKSSNGDTLQDLNERKAAVQRRLRRIRKKLEVALLALRPINDDYDSALKEDCNISCRLNIWWRQNRERYQVSETCRHSYREDSTVCEICGS